MIDLENIVIGKSAIPALIITIVLMFVILVTFFVFWWKKNKKQIKIIYLIAGAIGFVVSARVLEMGVHLICVVLDNPISRFINGNIIAYVLYGIIMAGVFEECGRYIIMKYILKKNRTPENAVLYGIGHGGIEVLVIVLPLMILYLAIAVLFSSGNIENALTTLNLTEETASVALPTIQAAASFDYGMMTLYVIERLFAMFLQIGLSVIVFYGICTKNKVCLPVAIILHMIVDLFPGLYQKNVVPLWAVEIWTALWTVLIVYIAVKRYKKLKLLSQVESN